MQKMSNVLSIPHCVHQTRHRSCLKPADMEIPFMSSQEDSDPVGAGRGFALQYLSTVQTDDGEDDLKKGTQLLEIYALEIQMYTAQKNNKKLKALYEQSLHIKSAIPHPLIMGVIRGTAAGQGRLAFIELLLLWWWLLLL